MWKSLTKLGYSRTFPQTQTLCHSLLSSTLLRGVEVWKSLTKLGYSHVFSHFYTSEKCRTKDEKGK